MESLEQQVDAMFERLDAYYYESYARMGGLAIRNTDGR